MIKRLAYTCMRNDYKATSICKRSSSACMQKANKLLFDTQSYYNKTLI